jgi:glutathione peroxidase-family protein
VTWCDYFSLWTDALDLCASQYGNLVSLDQFAGKVSVFVNVASE